MDAEPAKVSMYVVRARIISTVYGCVQITFSSLFVSGSSVKKNSEFPIDEGAASEPGMRKLAR